VSGARARNLLKMGQVIAQALLNVQAKILNLVGRCKGKRVSANGSSSSRAMLFQENAWARLNAMTNPKILVASFGERVSVRGFQRQPSAKRQLVIA